MSIIKLQCERNPSPSSSVVRNLLCSYLSVAKMRRIATNWHHRAIVGPSHTIKMMYLPSLIKNQAYHFALVHTHVLAWRMLRRPGVTGANSSACAGFGCGLRGRCTRALGLPPHFRRQLHARTWAGAGMAEVLLIGDPGDFGLRRSCGARRASERLPGAKSQVERPKRRLSKAVCVALGAGRVAMGLYSTVHVHADAHTYIYVHCAVDVRIGGAAPANRPHLGGKFSNAEHLKPQNSPLANCNAVTHITEIRSQVRSQFAVLMVACFTSIIIRSSNTCLVERRWDCLAWSRNWSLVWGALETGIRGMEDPTGGRWWGDGTADEDSMNVRHTSWT